MARPAWWALGELLDTPAAERPDSAAAAFDLLAGTVEGFAGLSYAALGLTGKRMGQGAGVPA
jgi:hypothetical protein